MKKYVIISIVIVLLIIFTLIFNINLLLKWIFFEDVYWGYECTQISILNKLGYSGKNVTIGIIDTGVCLDNEYLRSLKIIHWKDLINSCTTVYDDNGHGTHIVGIFAKVTYNANYVIIKALDKAGNSDDKIISCAINYCLDINNDGNKTTNDYVDILSLSLGGKTLPFQSSDLEDTVKYAISLGVYVVVAAGNDGIYATNVASPGNIPLTISVGAVDKDLKITEFSSQGRNAKYGRFATESPNKKPELVAPGKYIYSTWLNTYAYASGTSQAVPFVSITIAYILEEHSEYKHNYSVILHIKNILSETAKKLAGQEIPHDNRYGYGLVQAYDAFNRIK